MANVDVMKTTQARESTDQRSEITITDIEETDSENDERYVYNDVLQFR